ncbi:MAG TPA: ABC transporter ATP-binding protein [Actinomycetota bacterium]|nr:ABC transporter ATP-binding protein [Actinomycetota bacterium]
MSVVVSGARKFFRARRDQVVALDGVDLSAPAGRLVVVVGPSGSGKTTLLRAIAGLDRLDDGRIEVDGRDVTAVPPGERDVAMVFQEYALYPHLSVFENIAFGLRARRAPDVDELVAEAAAHVGLGGTLRRRPDQLSGGERQRVALARALVRKAAVFLMDEPLSNLDAELRTQMRGEIRMLHEGTGATTIYVTHDQVEAMAMADHVVVLRAGRVEQSGPPEEIYSAPRNVFVARFAGAAPMNIISADLVGAPDGVASIGVRAERAVLVERDGGRFAGKVRRVEFAGADAFVEVEVASESFLVRIDPSDVPGAGEEVGVAFADRDIHSFDRSGARLP